MVNVAIPLIREQFGISEAESGWMITGYALTFAVGVVGAGLPSRPTGGHVAGRLVIRGQLIEDRHLL